MLLKTKINLFGKACKSVFMPILYGLLIAISVFMVVATLIYIAGPTYAPLVFLIIGMVMVLVIVIKGKYDSLVIEHDREQKDIIDILKR